VYTTDSSGYGLTRVLGILGITALLSALNTGLFIAGPRDPRTWVQIVIGVAGVAAYLWVNVGRMRERFTGRGAFFLLSSVVTGALVVASAGRPELPGGQEAEDLGLTKEKIFTLSDQTDMVLKGLKSEVRVVAFYAPNEPSTAS